MVVNTKSPKIPLSVPASSTKERVSDFMQTLQDDICQGLEELDGVSKFKEDTWKRPGGGGGKSRVIKDGLVFEQGGVNFSEVWGEFIFFFA